MRLEFRAVQRIDIFRAGSYNQKQTSEFISACNCSIRHEHQRECGEEESLETIRLTVHLKFLAARILRHTPWQDAGLESMYTVLLQRDSRNEVCLQRINAYLRQEFDYELDHQEQVYLLIHLTKIVG